MRDENTVFLVGRLTRDPELTRTANTGKALVKFSLAVNHDEKECYFFPIQAWEKLAEIVAEHCRKGSKVLVRGSIFVRKWEDKEGVKRNFTGINAQGVTFMDAGGGQRPDRLWPEETAADPGPARPPAQGVAPAPGVPPAMRQAPPPARQPAVAPADDEYPGDIPF